jgi:hypothetical protein
MRTGVLSRFAEHDSSGYSTIERDSPSPEMSGHSFGRFTPIEYRHRSSSIMLFLGLNEIVLKNLYSSFFLCKQLFIDEKNRAATEALRFEHRSLENSYEVISQKYTEVTSNLDNLRLKRLFRVLDFVMSIRKQEGFTHTKLFRRD